MELKNILNENLIDVEIKDELDKDSLFKKMAQMLYDNEKISSVEEFVKALYERENTGSTYMGMGLAVPHGKSTCVKTPAVAIARFKPFVYDKEENEEAHVAVMLAIPDGVEQKEYIKMLADTASLLADEQFYNTLENEVDKSVILREFENGIANL